MKFKTELALLYLAARRDWGRISRTPRSLEPGGAAGRPSPPSHGAPTPPCRGPGEGRGGGRPDCQGQVGRKFRGYPGWRGPSPDAFWGTLGSQRPRGGPTGSRRPRGMVRERALALNTRASLLPGPRAAASRSLQNPPQRPEPGSTCVACGTRQGDIQRCQRVFRAEGRPNGHSRA